MTRHRMARDMKSIRFCLLVLMIVAVGCSKKKDKNASPQASHRDPTQAIVTVNGVALTNAEADELLDDRFNLIYGQQASQLPEVMLTQLTQRKKEMRHEIIEEFVGQQLLNAEVEKLGIQVADDDLNQTLAEQIEPNMTVETFVQHLEQNGHDPEKALAELRQFTTYQRLYELQYAGQLDINDSDIQQYYKAHKKFEPMTRPAQCRCRHILIDPNQIAPGEAPEIADQKARELAQTLLQKIHDNSDFAQLAQTYSNDPTNAMQGGDLGYFQKEDMVEPFNKTAFSLDINEVSDVVKTDYGYHIIQLLDKKPQLTLSLDEARAMITEQLTKERKSHILNAYLQKLKKDADIHYATE